MDACPIRWAAGGNRHNLGSGAATQNGRRERERTPGALTAT